MTLRTQRDEGEVVRLGRPGRVFTAVCTAGTPSFDFFPGMRAENCNTPREVKTCL